MRDETVHDRYGIPARIDRNERDFDASRILKRVPQPAQLSERRGTGIATMRESKGEQNGFSALRR